MQKQIGFLENLFSGNYYFNIWKYLWRTWYVSRINDQTQSYLSCKPSLKTIAIDAFSLKQNTLFYYIFPPSRLLRKVARKTTNDIINASLRKSTFKKYLTYQHQQKKYCTKISVRNAIPTLDQFLFFFTEFFKKGSSYSVLVSAKSSAKKHMFFTQSIITLLITVLWKNYLKKYLAKNNHC